MTRRYWGAFQDRFEEVASWKYRVCIWRQCHVTGKNLIFKRAYEGTRIITGPGDPVIEKRWYSAEAFMTKVLKGEIKWGH